MDAIFYLKSMPVKGLPSSIKEIVLDPIVYGLGCDGADKLCSTAYSQLWQHLGGFAGIMQGLRKKYGVDGRVAFVGFSAAHGMLNPLLNNDIDRADISAVILMDATFGGSKNGYVKAAKDAAAGKMLLVTATSDKGSIDALNNGDYAWYEYVIKPAQLGLSQASAQAPMPAPSKGVLRLGGLWYYRYSHAELPHQEMSKLTKPAMDAHLIPFLAAYQANTGRGSKGSSLGTVALVGAALYAAYKILASIREVGTPRRS